MIEVFRYRKRFYLVFEFVEGTVLDELEKMPRGLGEDRCRERIYQVTRAINYCHTNHVSRHAYEKSMNYSWPCHFKRMRVNSQCVTDFLAMMHLLNC